MNKAVDWDGSKVIDPDVLTFKVGDVVKENKTFSSAIKIKDVNSASRECEINLGAQYQTLTTSLYYTGKHSGNIKNSICC